MESSKLSAIEVDAMDPAALARFWAGILGWQVDQDYTLVPSDATGFLIRFLPGGASKVGPNQVHFDLTSDTDGRQDDTVRRALDRGAAHIDVGQLPEEGHVVLADPEGNEFCVLEAGNSFLADCVFLGAVNCDGSQALGYFWSAALGWPLVWDQDEETAIRSPDGGPMITWSGPPVRPKLGRNRLRFELTAPSGLISAEIERLVALGATVVAEGVDGHHLIDPDGNEFTVLA